MSASAPAAAPSRPRPALLSSRLDVSETIRRALENRFVRFLLVGGLNTAFGYGVFALLVLAGVHYAVAAFFATVLGVLFNFRTTGRLVFGNRDDRLLLRFVLVYAISYVVGVASLRAAKSAGMPVLLAGAVLQLPMSLFTFGLQRAIVFRDPR